MPGSIVDSHVSVPLEILIFLTKITKAGLMEDIEK